MSVLLAIDLESCGEKATPRPRFKNWIVGSGAIVIEASFCIGFADLGFLADFSDVLHEVASKPAHGTPAYAAPSSAPFFRASVVKSTKFTGRQEPKPSSN